MMQHQSGGRRIGARILVCVVATLAIPSSRALMHDFGGTSIAWTSGDFNYDGGVNTADFNALANNFTLADSYRSTLYTNADVRFTNHRRDDRKLSIETSWLPHVLAAQQAEAGIKLNPETLKALAVADRSLLFYSLEQKGWISSGHGAPDCDLTLTP